MDEMHDVRVMREYIMAIDSGISDFIWFIGIYIFANYSWFIDLVNCLVSILNSFILSLVIQQ